MKVILYGSPESTMELQNKVNNSLEDLGLSGFIKVELSQNKALKEELAIEKEPALIIVEESIEFKDTIFEGIIPKDEEIKSMFISIIGGEGGGSCGKMENGSCGTGCAC